VICEFFQVFFGSKYLTS